MCLILILPVLARLDLHFHLCYSCEFLLSPLVTNASSVSMDLLQWLSLNSLTSWRLGQKGILGQWLKKLHLNDHHWIYLHWDLVVLLPFLWDNIIVPRYFNAKLTYLLTAFLNITFSSPLKPGYRTLMNLNAWRLLGSWQATGSFPFLAHQLWVVHRCHIRHWLSS